MPRWRIIRGKPPRALDGPHSHVVELVDWPRGIDALVRFADQDGRPWQWVNRERLQFVGDEPWTIGILDARHEWPRWRDETTDEAANQTTPGRTDGAGREPSPTAYWWESDPAERFWLEITDRPDIGVDLHCPQTGADGRPSPGYSLIHAVRVGDVVFHYDTDARAIAACSVAVGSVVEGETVWISHRGATRRRLGTTPRPQPGWFLDLEGPRPLEPHVTLETLRARASDVMAIRNHLARLHTGRSIYFPFMLHGGAELRPMQPYLNKLPADLVELFPVMAAAAESARAGSSVVSRAVQSPSPVIGLGAPYREAVVMEGSPEREPYAVDPAIVERGLRGHVDTQNALAALLRHHGIEPRRPMLGPEPNYDLAWEAGDSLWVAEVKSTTSSNMERQLRLGLGQVLRYRQVLRATSGRIVIAVLVSESDPPADWIALCESVGVRLVGKPSLQAQLRTLVDPLSTPQHVSQP